MCHSSLTSMIQQLCSSGFSIRVQLMGDILGKIEEKSDGHYKTNFLWPKQWGTWGDQPMFQLVEGPPPPNPPTRGNPANSYQRNQETTWFRVLNLIFVKCLIQRIPLYHYMRFNLNDLTILEH